MAGYIGLIQQAQDGKSYGFVIHDDAHKPCMYLGLSTWHEADKAARDMQGLLAKALVCEPRSYSGG